MPDLLFSLKFALVTLGYSYNPFKCSFRRLLEYHIRHFDGLKVNLLAKCRGVSKITKAVTTYEAVFYWKMPGIWFSLRLCSTDVIILAFWHLSIHMLYYSLLVMSFRELRPKFSFMCHAIFSKLSSVIVFICW